MRFFRLTGTQMVIGGALTLIIHTIGTGIPIMIFIQSILLSHYYKISGSVVASVIAGGLSYATFHLFEFWTLYDGTAQVPQRSSTAIQTNRHDKEKKLHDLCNSRRNVAAFHYRWTVH
ncbi:MAG: hypothetical protein R3C14_19180 [Caldilineaceae bacterium]